MQKITAFALCFILLFSLCGCSIGATATEKGLEFLVSAIGFDQQNDLFSVAIETINVNSEDAESDKKLSLIKGTGKNLSEALNNATQKSVRPFMFSHCAAAVIGSGVSEKGFRNICTFLYEKDEINLSLNFISTKNAEKLLSSETVASVAVGYDLTDMLDRQSNYSGIKYKNRFYEIEEARKNPTNIFSLPWFETEEKGYKLSGLTVFRNDIPVMELNQEQAFAYSLVTDAQKKGTVLINNQKYLLKGFNRKQSFELDKRLGITLTLDITLDGNKNIKPQISKTIIRLFTESQRLETDIFMFGNEIYRKKPKLWQKLRHNYATVYKNSTLAVTVK